MGPIIVSLLLLLVASVWIYIRYAYGYWKRKGVPYLKPKFPFGNFPKCILQRASLSEEYDEIYTQTSEPFIGLYSFLWPSILIRDPILIRDVLMKDFSSFANRGFHARKEVDPIANNLLVQTGDEWKTSRSIMTPAFSSGKVRNLLNTIIKFADALERYLMNYNGKSLDIRELVARSTTNITASIGFGIEIDALNYPNCDFCEYGHRYFSPSFRNAIRNMAFFLLPSAFARIFGLRMADKEVGDFMIETVKQTVDHREKNNVTRKDFLQLLMQVRNTGEIRDGDDWTTKATNGKKFMKLEEIAAHSFTFVIGGYESTSSAVSFGLYELARNPDIQQKAYEEIETVLNKYDGELSYDAIAEMKYIGQCINETLRMHSPFGFFSRECTKDYKFRNSNAIIEKGTFVMISASAVHMDPKYFPEPEEFQPERFAQEKSFIDRPFLSFGDGPRNCIGKRMGELQSKVLLITLLRKFKFELGDQHIGNKIELDPKAGSRTPKNGINLKISSRQ